MSLSNHGPIRLAMLLLIVQTFACSPFSAAAGGVQVIPDRWTPLNLALNVPDTEHKKALSITATTDGAKLICKFQNLEGKLTPEGLWLRDLALDGNPKPFRITCVSFGRTEDQQRDLTKTGTVMVRESSAKFLRAGLAEEFSVSMDGVRQDFVVEHSPEGVGALRIILQLEGCHAEQSRFGARITLPSGRKLAYHNLRVVDATGARLAARMDVLNPMQIAITVEESTARYPVRIDRTFSDEDWSSMGGLLGADSYVNAAVVDGDGNLYIGGNFEVVGSVVANRIAKWNGGEWTSLGGGLDWDVWALAASGTDVYVGGDFSWADETGETTGISVNRIAKWDGVSWSALGSGIGVPPGPDVWDYVAALTVVGTNVYAGGYFEVAGGVPVAHIAKWNGAIWSTLGAGMDDEVYALASFRGDLYAGGFFTTAGGASADYIARWNGARWSPVGGGMDDTVHALIVHNEELYAGGAFTLAGSAFADHVARWNGASWFPLGSGVDDRVTSLATSGTDLYVGGWFSTAGTETDAYYVAKWNGSTWSALGEGLDDYVSALAVVGTNLFVGGDFEFAAEKEANYLARWNGFAWSASGSPGLSGWVHALVASEGTVYAGGDFTTADFNPANNIARWDGNSWVALGTCMDNQVLSLAILGDQLYAGGNFTKAGGNEAIHIARWNGAGWSPLGSGMNQSGFVSAMAVSGTNLYVGGNFSKAGEIDANYVARWNGSAWSALGAGSYTTVNAMAALGPDIYAGGYVSLSKWDGTNWTDLRTQGQTNEYPVNNHVYALTSIGADLYVGGNFSQVGDLSVNGIARWDGRAWHPLNSGIDGYVAAFAVSGPHLYVGGFFANAGGLPAQNIAKWDGNTFSTLGSGMSAGVNALAVLGEDLYVGGTFLSAGREVSAYAARARIASDNPEPGVFAEIKVSAPSGVSFIFAEGTLGRSYRIQKSSSPSGPWEELQIINFSGPASITDSSPALISRFYRAVSP